jgi:hypothetical protein
MRQVNLKDKNPQRDWDVWTPSTRVGEIMEDLLNTIFYDRAS